MPANMAAAVGCPTPVKPGNDRRQPSRLGKLGVLAFFNTARIELSYKYFLNGMLGVWHMNSTGQVFEDCRDGSLCHCRKLVFAILSLAIILLAVYSNSFDCSWQFDDEPNITDNSNIHLRKITWQGIKHSLFSDPNNPNFPYRPVAGFTFALNHYFGGLDVFGYHLVNLIIHWLSAIFLFLFIYHTLNLPKLKDKYAEHAYNLALLATVLWAIILSRFRL